MHDRVLMLNSSYMPLALVDWTRAVCLLFQGKADQVVEGSKVVHSPSTSMVIPAIIRLHSPVYPSKRKVRLSRKNVLLRDNYRCQYCGEVFPASKLNMDHVIPRVKGGKTLWTNIVTSCVQHNLAKGGRTPKEAGMNLIGKPEPPNWTLAHEIVQHMNNIPESWRPYLKPYLKE